MSTTTATKEASTPSNMNDLVKQIASIWRKSDTDTIPNDIVVNDVSDVSVLGVASVEKVEKGNEDGVEQVWRNELIKELRPPTEEDVAAIKARDSVQNVPEPNDQLPSSVSTIEESAVDPIAGVLPGEASVDRVNWNNSLSGELWGKFQPVLFVDETATPKPATQDSNVQGFNEGGNYASFSSSPESWMVLKPSVVHSKKVNGVHYYSIEGLNAYVVNTLRGKMICLNDVIIPYASFLKLRRTKTIWKSRIPKVEPKTTGNDLRFNQPILDQSTGAKLFFEDNEPPVFVKGADCHSIVMLAKHLCENDNETTFDVDSNSGLNTAFLAAFSFFTGVFINALLSR